jgi:hypothetical protein
MNDFKITNGPLGVVNLPHCGIDIFTVYDCLVEPNFRSLHQFVLAEWVQYI